MQENEEIIVKEILKKSRWYEKIIIKLFKKLMLKIYNNARVDIINRIL